ncbi:MAG: Wzz/FepE/Etk N-terminal domain-containing protein, partial [Lewinella sp.]|uniref:Wzz/FepE/Etk N-terminal domain-containing protein n=1 Tax=Lewinella sp. TaxID=2004506 RepID=UPI003D6A4FEE
MESTQQQTAIGRSETDSLESSIDLREILLSILRNWYWVALCLVLAFIGARLYLRYAVPIYRASGKILIKDAEGRGAGSSLTEEAVLQEIGLFSPTNNINNEIQI